MSEIQGICTSVSVVSIVSGVILVCFPENKLTSAFKSLVLIIIIYFAASGFTRLDFDVESLSEESIYDKKEADTAAEEALLLTAEELLSEDITNFLSEQGFDCEVEAEIINDEGVKIESIRISGVRNNEERKKIRDILLAEFGEEIKTELTG